MVNSALKRPNSRCVGRATRVAIFQIVQLIRKSMRLGLAGSFVFDDVENRVDDIEIGCRLSAWSG